MFLVAPPFFRARTGAFSSYEEFDAYIQGVADVGIAFGDKTVLGRNYLVPGETIGKMWGTPWGSVFTEDSDAARVLQHGLPSYDVFISIFFYNRASLLIVDDAGSYATTGLDRNGYASLSYDAYPANVCPALFYWDDLVGAAMAINPYSMGAPNPIE